MSFAEKFEDLKVRIDDMESTKKARNIGIGLLALGILDIILTSLRNYEYENQVIELDPNDVTIEDVPYDEEEE